MENKKAEMLMKDYFDWDYDVNKNSRRRAKIAYAFAALMTVIAVVSLLALTAIAPLKEIQPLVVTVDASTGVTEVKHNLTGVDITNQEALDKYFIGQYIKSVENYTYYSHENDRKNALGFSDGNARRYYLTAQSTDNPNSFVNLYKDNYQRQVVIKEVVLIDVNKKVAQVRFYAKDGLSNPRHFTATLKYTYVDADDIPFSFLLNNPLGFVVSEYRIDEVSQ